MILLPLAVLSLSVAALAQQTAPPAQAGNPDTAAAQVKPVKITLAPGIGSKASQLEGLQWIKGNPVKIETGKVYLIEFWATWCPPCKESIPHLTELQARYADKITVIGVSSEKAETVKPFVDNMGERMDYHVAVDTQGKVTRSYSEAYNQQGIPHGFIVDQKGNIVWYGHPAEGMDYVLAEVAAGNFDPLAYARQKAEAEALNKQLSDWFNEYFAKLQSEGASEETNRIATAFIEKAHPDALLAFAWNIVIRLKDEHSKAIALTAAEKANQLTGGAEPMVLDTLATTLFANGKLNEAIATEQRAMELAQGNPQMQEVFQKRLLEFRTEMYKKTTASKGLSEKNTTK